MLNPGTRAQHRRGDDARAEPGGRHRARPAARSPTRPARPSRPTRSPRCQSGSRTTSLRDNDDPRATSVGIWLTNATQRHAVRGNALAANGDDGVWIERSHATTGSRPTRSTAPAAPASRSRASSDNTVARQHPRGERRRRPARHHARRHRSALPSNDNRVEGNTIEESGGRIEVDRVRRQPADRQRRRAARTARASRSTSRATPSCAATTCARNKGGISLRLERQPDRGQRRQRVRGHRHRARGAVARATILLQQHLEQQRRRRHLRRRRDRRRLGDADRGQHDQQQQGLRHLCAQGQPHDQGQHRQRQRQLGHLGQRGQQRPRQHRRRRQPARATSARSTRSRSSRCSASPPLRRRRRAAHRPDRAGHLDPRGPARPEHRRRRDVPLHRQRQRQRRSTFQCSLDGAALRPVRLARRVRGPRVGTHTFEVRAVDVSGNVDPTPATHTWAIEPAAAGRAARDDDRLRAGPDDGAAPTRRSSSPPTSAARRSSARSTRGRRSRPCTSPQDATPGWRSARTRFRVRATDADGNADATPATYAWSDRARAGGRRGGLRRDPRPEHLRAERPDRLPRPRPDRRRRTASRSTSTATSSTASGSTPASSTTASTRSRSPTARSTSSTTASCSTPAPSLNVVSGLRLELNQEAGIALSDADQNGNGNTIRDNTIVAQRLRHRALQQHAQHRRARQRARRQRAATACCLEFASDNRIEANEIVRSGGAGVVMERRRRATRSSTTSSTPTTAAASPSARSCCRPTTTASSATRSRERRRRHQRHRLDRHAVLFNDVARLERPRRRARPRPRHARARQRPARQRGRHRAERVERQPDRVQQRQRHARHRHRDRGRLARQHDRLQHRQRQRRRGHRGRGLGARPARATCSRATPPTATAATASRRAASATRSPATRAQLNGGWGIYAAGRRDRRRRQLRRRQRRAGAVLRRRLHARHGPGRAGDLDRRHSRPAVSNSRNASFTYMGSDDVTPLAELVFECRLDTTNDLAWEDCEYPDEVLNLSPGQHTLRGPRRRRSSGLADPTPATLHAGPTCRCRPASRRRRHRHRAGGRDLGARRALHVPLQRARRHLRVQGRHAPVRAVRLRGRRRSCRRARFEWGLEETEVGPHTFSRARDRLRGQRRRSRRPTPGGCSASSTQFTAGPGLHARRRTASRPTGGEVARARPRRSTSGQRRRRDLRVLARPRAVRALRRRRSPTPGLGVGDHELRVVATDSERRRPSSKPAVYEWEVVDSTDTAPPETTIERAPATGTSSTIFEFAGTDDLTPPSLLTFECRVDSTNDAGLGGRAPARSTCSTSSPTRTRRWRRAEHTFEVRAIDDAEPLIPTREPELRGQRRPDAGPLHLDDGRRHDAARHGDRSPARRRGRSSLTATFEFFGTDNATPGAADVRVLARRRAVRAVQLARVRAACEPGAHTLRVRAVDLAGNVDPTPATRTLDGRGAAGHDDHRRARSPRRARTSARSSPSPPTSPASTFECSLDGADFVPCTLAARRRGS